jgi:tetratricopeptide (TPR) repeat protein
LKQLIPAHNPLPNATVSVRQLRIPDKARDEYQHGLQSLGKNDLQGALKHFTKARADYPDYYEAEYHAGLTQLRMGQREEAIQSFQQAVDLSDGRYAPAELGVGALLYESGNTPEAEKAVRRGLELDDTRAQGYALLGMILIREQRPDEAEKSAREALLRNPAFTQTYLVLSDVHASRKEYRLQLQDLDAFLALEPEGPEKTRIVQVREFVLRNIAKSESLVASALN